MSAIDQTTKLTAVQLAQIIHEAIRDGDQATVLRYALQLADSVLAGEHQSRQQADARRDASGKEIIPAEELNAMSTDQLVELQERDPELYKRSLKATAGS